MWLLALRPITKGLTREVGSCPVAADAIVSSRKCKKRGRGVMAEKEFKGGLANCDN